METTQVKTFHTPYGNIPVKDGQRIYSEDAHKVMQNHFVEKINHRGYIKMSRNERQTLNAKIANHPNKNHSPCYMRNESKIENSIEVWKGSFGGSK